jgi:hypothetical protein
MPDYRQLNRERSKPLLQIKISSTISPAQYFSIFRTRPLSSLITVTLILWIHNCIQSKLEIKSRSYGIFLVLGCHPFLNESSISKQLSKK